jgi:hypothetical protein
MQTESVTRIMNALENIMAVSPTRRCLDTIKRYHIEPEQIDDVILTAINASLCLVSDGDDRVAEGFNEDIALNGRDFRKFRRIQRNRDRN